VKKPVTFLLTAGSLAAGAFLFSAFGGSMQLLPEVVQKGCGSCHMAFPPQMLPARSWTAIMDGLDKHLGENVVLDAERRKKSQTG
jgi:hypothetical protein